MRPGSLLFTLFGDFVRYYGGEIWAGSLIQLMQEFGFSPQAVRVSLSRLTGEGWLQNRKAGKRSFYGLTEAGQKRIAEGASRIYKLENPVWNGEWTIVTYTIPEVRKATRDRLRKELTWTGFGQLASSVWISPRDLHPQLQRLAERYAIGEAIDCFTARYEGPGENRRLVERCWDLDAIQDGYRQFIIKYKRKVNILQRQAERDSNLPANTCFREEVQLIHEYRKFLFIDPGLPDELLPSPWLGRDAAQLMQTYYRLVSPAAHAFFSSVFVAHPDDRSGACVQSDAHLDPFAEELRRQRLADVSLTSAPRVFPS